MNYLEALKKEGAVVPISKKEIVPVKEVILTDEENYKLNVEDSMISSYLPEVQSMCQKFVDETLYLDHPLLDKHHCGYSNFIVEMMSLYESTTGVEIEECDEESFTDLDEELDPSDIIYQKDDKF